MGNYIVFDLEWNQGKSVKERNGKSLPFEIIEIGAIRLDENMKRTGEFNRLICPQIYKKMHKITENLIHITMDDLKSGDDFVTVVNDFLNWCGEDPIFCTWGPLDLTELQRNMDFFDMKLLSDRPLPFYDVQKLYSIMYEDGKMRRSLEHATDSLGMEKDSAFHRALSDADYTARIFVELDKKVLYNYSFDNYVTPKTKDQEVHIVFDHYAKYISREFKTKEELLADPEVMGTKCYLCNHPLRRKIKWFSINGKHFYSVSICKEHGYMKAKVRVKKTERDRYYAVKTLKFITEKEMREVKAKTKKKKY